MRTTPNISVPQGVKEVEVDFEYRWTKKKIGILKTLANVIHVFLITQSGCNSRFARQQRYDCNYQQIKHSNYK